MGNIVVARRLEPMFITGALGLGSWLSLVEVRVLQLDI